MRIAHLTSAHPRFDARIFLKECGSFAKRGHDVVLIVADGQGPACVGGVEIVDVGSASSRLRRMTGAARRVVSRAADLNCDVYHLHDPELLPYASQLKRIGKVIYDAHEDLPSQILSKPYLNHRMRIPVAALAAKLQYHFCRRLDGVVSATPHIRDTFLKQNIESIDVNNFPILDEFGSFDNSVTQREAQISYIGSISLTRGFREIVNASQLVKSNITINIAGPIGDESLRREIHSGGRIKVHGFLEREDVRELLSHSIAGLVTLHPTPSYLHALPVKMFEYMAAGIPVIASDFPLWRHIVNQNDCGICVDPHSPEEIARAMNYFIEHPEEARRMGANGRQAVETIYNWKTEEDKLMNYYESITSKAIKSNKVN